MINQGRSSERTFQNLSDYKPKYRPVEVTESIESTARRIALDLGASELIYDGNASAYAHERMLPRTEALMIDKWNAEGGITGMTLVLRGQGEIQASHFGRQIFIPLRGRGPDQGRASLQHTHRHRRRRPQGTAFGCADRSG